MRLATIILALVLALPAHAEEEPKITEETPYVQSPSIVVETMLKMAQVRASDFLIDLGSGDGRILITAAKKYGARGFGVDYDPRLVKLATDNARKAGVGDRVTFLEQDIFKTDLRSASVVAMYLLPNYNLVLKARLLQLKPGTRVVSHDYGIGDWPADAELTVPAPEKPVGVRKESTIYLWIVPAPVEGAWTTVIPGARGAQSATLRFEQHYQRLEGTLQIGKMILRLERTWLRANYLSFRVQDGPVTIRFQGYAKSGRISGEVARSNGGSLRWRALRADSAPLNR